jgi:hypothetical protein
MANLLTLPVTTAVAAGVGQPMILSRSPRNLAVQFNFIYGSGGTSVDAYLQTSLDNGATWTDIANFSATTASLRRIINLIATTPKTAQVTPTDGSMSANTALDGILGPLFRVKYTTVGTYAATTIAVGVQADQITAGP